MTEIIKEAEDLIKEGIAKVKELAEELAEKVEHIFAPEVAATEPTAEVPPATEEAPKTVGEDTPVAAV